MVYSTQNFWGFGLFHRPVFLGVETRRFGKWICFHPQEKRDKTFQLGPLERAIHNQWTTPVRSTQPYNHSREGQFCGYRRSF
jgi:hypothetical protein